MSIIILCPGVCVSVRIITLGEGFSESLATIIFYEEEHPNWSDAIDTRQIERASELLLFFAQSATAVPPDPRSRNINIYMRYILSFLWAGDTGDVFEQVQTWVSFFCPSNFRSITSLLELLSKPPSTFPTVLLLGCFVSGRWPVSPTYASLWRHPNTSAKFCSCTLHHVRRRVRRRRVEVLFCE